MQERTRMTLRLPDDLKDVLRRIAQNEDRSLHSLVIHVLRQYISDRWAADR